MVMRDMLARECPDHGIVGEEFGTVNASADYVWTLDPIDRTRAFIIGMPIRGTLIGLQHKGKPILGLMDQPFIGERFWNDERAAWYRGPAGLTRCEVRRCGALRSGPPLPQPRRICSKGRTRLASAGWRRPSASGGPTTIVTLIALALGQIDIVAEAGLKPYDIVPLIPIIEKAGGEVRSWDGGPAEASGHIIACGDRALLEPALALLK